MYDVGIELLPSESLSKEQQVHIDFHIAYFNPAYTEEQLFMKLIFGWWTFIVTLAYSAKMGYLLIIKGKHPDMFPFDCYATWGLLWLLLCFDDPSYKFHVEDPNFFTYFISEFGISLFIAGLLMYWVRDIARYRADELAPNQSKMQKFLHNS